PGVEVLAELFVGESDGTLHILDANTGRRSSTISVDRAITGIAVDDSRIFVTGDGILRAFRRTTREEIWSTATEGSRVLGHPLVDNSRVLIFFESGVIQLYDATSGALIWTTSIPPQMVARGAVSNEWIFAGNNIGNMYGLQGQAQ
ncbi:MAG: PQQ-binding-like beta-propeller repeat protein, partial [Caldilineaceae bacterium]|nr:PQQ-binding-like beta-propeller repeat protein [Caldilineaceae bacterium]